MRGRAARLQSERLREEADREADREAEQEDRERALLELMVRIDREIWANWVKNN